jgi:hypothetical protein
MRSGFTPAETAEILAQHYPWVAPELQRALYASLEHLGPQWSAIVSGYAVSDWFGRVYITPAGERYLSQSFIAMKLEEDERR